MKRVLGSTALIRLHPGVYRFRCATCHLDTIWYMLAADAYDAQIGHTRIHPPVVREP